MGNMTGIILHLDKGWFDKAKVKASKDFDDNIKKNFPNDTEALKTVGKGYLFDLDAGKQELNVDDGGIEMSFSAEGGNENYLSLYYKFDEEDLIAVAAMIIKKHNKAKAMFESM